jgi:hypothetical protein
LFGASPEPAIRRLFRASCVAKIGATVVEAIAIDVVNGHLASVTKPFVHDEKLFAVRQRHWFYRNSPILAHIADYHSVHRDIDPPMGVRFHVCVSINCPVTFPRGPFVRRKKFVVFVVHQGAKAVVADRDLFHFTKVAPNG